MTVRRRRQTLCLLVSLTAAIPNIRIAKGQRPAGVYPYPDRISQLMGASDEIIFGRFEPQQRDQLGTGAAAGRFQVRLRVLARLEGPDAGPELTVEDDVPGPTRAPRDSYIFFLRSTPGGFRFAAMVRWLAARPVTSTRDLRGTIEEMVGAAIASPDTDDADRFWAVQAVAGDPSPNLVITQDVEAGLQWTPADERALEIAVLMVRGVPDGLALAQEFLAHTDWAGRSGPIIGALGQIGGSASFRLLAAVAGTSEPEPARKEALTVLGDTRSSAALPALETGLRDPDWRVRSESATALGRTMLPGGIPFLASALDDPVEAVRYRAYCSLVSISVHEPEILLDEKDFEAHEAQYISKWKQWARENTPGGGSG